MAIIQNSRKSCNNTILKEKWQSCSMVRNVAKMQYGRVSGNYAVLKKCGNNQYGRKSGNN